MKRYRVAVSTEGWALELSYLFVAQSQCQIFLHLCSVIPTHPVCNPEILFVKNQAGGDIWIIHSSISKIIPGATEKNYKSSQVWFIVSFRPTRWKFKSWKHLQIQKH